jgi:hypothetical protein
VLLRVRVLSKYPGYAISSEGRIRGKYSQWLKPVPNTQGYPRVTLQLPGGRQKTVPVHVLVCEAFHGPKPFPGAQARHLDGNKFNNRADNLCWGTGTENQADRVTHGTAMAGEEHPRATITEADVRKIRERYAAGGVTYRSLGIPLGISEQQVYRIVQRKAWTHVT